MQNKYTLSYSTVSVFYAFLKFKNDNYFFSKTIVLSR